MVKGALEWLLQLHFGLFGALLFGALRHVAVL
jgi:hypothetical protein